MEPPAQTLIMKFVSSTQIAHYPTLSSVPDEMSGPLQAEIDAYKRALRSCYEQYGAKMICWEISRTAGAKSAHAHIQVS